MERQPLRFRATLLPMVLGAVSAMLVYALYTAAYWRPRPYLVIQTVLVGAGALVAGTLFVLPVFAVIPRMRRPPLWVAAIWGVFVSWAATFLTGPINSAFTEMLRLELAVPSALTGAVAGVTYALSARRR